MQLAHRINFANLTSITHTDGLLKILGIVNTGMGIVTGTKITAVNYDTPEVTLDTPTSATAQPAETARLTAAVVAWHRSLPADNGATYMPPAKKKAS